MRWISARVGHGRPTVFIGAGLMTATGRRSAVHSDSAVWPNSAAMAS